jgi:FkbM family methyltransferase
MAVINKPVIVMALYDIGRDNWKNFNLSYNTYLWWMKNTLSLDADFVIYTEEKFSEKIREMREEFDPTFQKTKLIVKPIEELEYYVEYNDRLTQLMFSDEFKEKAHHNVPEMTQPLYNIIMFNKLSFLKDSKDNGYFDGDLFIWADAGGLREDISNYQGISWPDLDKVRGLDTKKITFFSHSPEFHIDNNEFHSLSQIRHIQGTCFFVPKDCLDKFVTTFKETVNESLESGYIGSDEKVLDITYCKSKQDYNLIHCTWREYFGIFQGNPTVDIPKESEVEKTNVFLDLGTHGGQGLHRFKSILGFDETWDIHTFEPNNLLHPINTDQFDFKVTPHNTAIWVKQGNSIFKQYGDDGKSQGSLLEQTNGDRHYHDYHDSIEVETIDFHNYLKNFSSDQSIYIKMNIEWAEWTVLEDLLVRGWPKNIKQMWINFHGAVGNQFYKNKSVWLIDQIRQEGCEVTEWN